jgi:NADPH-dependent 2,4-dienoyl-CoA reductase/sulfur reductase-like enzyme
LNHTVTYIKGRERLESVTIAQVDEKMNVVPGTEREIECDTLLLSLGLIPENELSQNVGIEIDDVTGGPIIDQSFETSLPGVFACGNCLQVYDTVDVLAMDAKKAGMYAVKDITGQNKNIKVKAGKGIRYVVPQRICKPGAIHFTLRVEKPCELPTLRVVSDGKEILKKKLRFANPANMVEFDAVVPANKDLEVLLDDN